MTSASAKQINISFFIRELLLERTTLGGTPLMCGSCVPLRPRVARKNVVFQMEQVCSLGTPWVKHASRVRRARSPLFRCLVFGELCGREFAPLDVARVDLRKMLPLLGQVVQHKNRGHGADGDARAAVYALDRINVKLRDFVEC